VDFRENISKVMYGVGAFFAALTVLYFGSEYILEFSPVTKSLLLFTAFLGFLVLGLKLSRKESRRLSHVSIGLGVVSFLSFAAYTAGKFDFTSEEVFLLLLTAAVTFTGLGYLFRNEKIERVVEESGKILAALMVFALALTAVDYAGEKPSSEVSFREQVDVSPGEESMVGEVEVRNGFFLPRDIEVHSYSVCLSHNGTTLERGLMHEDAPDMLGAREVFSSNLSYRSPPPRYENVSGVFEVEEVEECPPRPENGVMYVFSDEGLPRPAP
jgi:hypothetical protein